MIVADTNLIAYLLIAGPFSAAAQRVFDRDPTWVSPGIWRAELLNVLATSVREGHLAKEKAQNAWAHAPAFIRDAEVPPLEVLDLAVTTRFATFDCFFGVLARKLNAPLVTADKKLLRDFSDIAVSIEAFASGT
jgi:predicted nucleic acid-binding protein